jgi:hypothetical protein
LHVRLLLDGLELLHQARHLGRIASPRLFVAPG